ncbi:MAG: PASTA domain-containing protein [Acidobacteria bacterium]|nr:PASTA domain-containing protein [Acidobacteriota bacterium]
MLRARRPGVRQDGGHLPLRWRSVLRARVVVAAVFFAVATAGIEARLIYLQVFQHTSMQALADRQHNRMIAAPAKRGEIVDRNGNSLAYSVDVDTIVADPSDIDDPDGVARQVCAALRCDKRDREDMARNLRRNSQFAYLARKISAEGAQRVRDLNLKGIALVKESRRFYPKKELAAHVLGYVGLDNTGLAGLEHTYDTQVRGREGKIQILNDARQQALHSRVERPPTAGVSLELTIDQYLQHITERELRIGVEENRAAGGTAVVMDPASGEILALANWPTFNPNSYGRSEESARRNRATQDLYEPGSTFKVVTASAALEEDVIGSEDPIDCAPGHIAFGSRVIRDVHAYGVLSFNDVIVKSSNVGAIKVGLRLGPERLGRYVSRFGFGQAIGPDFRGENPGIVWNPARLDSSALASLSMGYQVGVTPLQMAAAVSSIANGGSLVEPRVLRAFIKDGARTPVARKVLRQTVSADTAAELTSIMESVVERGTGKYAQIAGYTIAGKTGTAAKLVNGHYSKSEYNASFVGFVPSRQPALTIIVLIDTPRARGYYGGAVAAPVFKRIAEASLRHMGIGPTINAPSPVLAAQYATDGSAFLPRAAFEGEVVGAALPSPEAGVMPDLRGRSAREALRTLTRIGATARVLGQGFVVEQSPRAGEPLDPGEVALLVLDRRIADARSGTP